jgi:hypothetical protein
VIDVDISRVIAFEQLLMEEDASSEFFGVSGKSDFHFVKYN